MSTSQERPSRSSRIWVIVAIVLIAVAGGIYVVQHGGTIIGGSEAECERLVGMLNEALGNLEAAPTKEPQRLPLADQALTDLARRFPNELATVRNLAICRAMAFDGLTPQEVRELTVDFDGARQALEKLEPKSPIPHYLAGRVATRKEDISKAVDELTKAAELAPDDATLWYALYDLARPLGDSDDALKRVAERALGEALKAQPSNSYLLKETLLIQVQNNDPQAVETVKVLLKEIEPLRSAIKLKTRQDIKDLGDRMIAAVNEGNWKPAQYSATVIKNVIVSEEWVRSDLRRLNRHPLTYVVSSFSSAVCPNTHPSTGDDSPRIEFRLQAQPRERSFPELAGVVDLNLTDFDLDGTTDVIALSGIELTVFSRKAIGQPWEDALSVPVREPMRGMLVADLDRDENAKPLAARPEAAGARDAKPGDAGAAEANRGDTKPAGDEMPAVSSDCQPADVEVVVFGPAGVQVFRNDLDFKTLKRTLVPAGLGDDLEALKNVLAGVLVDVDHDGDLDLVLSAETGISIWANAGQLRFVDITDRSALPPTELAASRLVAVDWDRDLDTDILLVGPGTNGTGSAPAGWLENLRHGSMRWRPFENDLQRLSGSKWLAVLEVDGNASWDLLGIGAKGVHLARTKTEIPGTVNPLDFTEVAREPFDRSLVGDFDNDTRPDLLGWGEKGLNFFRGCSQPWFKPDDVLQPVPKKAAACAAADLDGDGDLDLVVAEPDKLVLYDNDGGNKNRWLAVRTKGESGDNQGSGDVNHLGIGSLLELKTGRKYQAQLVTGQVTHFGLGKKDAADVLRVIWTNGVPQPVVAPKADTNICRVHVIGTSCPYFYTWDGERFVFCTDACWAAPLGLQLAEGVFAQPRAWEYLLVPGEKLKPRDGKYLVQMTEELWEATYLDQMELIAVDHPGDVDIFSNEKVGPPELAEFKIHTVRDKQYPVAARDKHGRDVFEEICREDGVFMKGFDNEPRHGLADEHYLELDLGSLDHPRRVTLYLTGWLFPASTSLNVGVSQDRSLPAPRPPAIEVPDKDGRWQLVRPFMGFPGGRTKTIAVDLSGIFLTDDYRLRIITNMEFCWDAAFFTVDEDPAPLDLTRLPASSADLHFRGYSAIVPRPGFGPDGYDYDRVTTAPKWAPMAGRFTRFGDVTELLRETDDLQVVFGSGDELTVAFDVPEQPVPPGWKRDFLLHNVGWDKDNDLNVVTSQTVEPLPFNGMSGYPYGGEESYPDTPSHRQYLRNYQTREQWPVDFWRAVQQFGK